MKTKISVIILTKNEEKNIQRALKSVDFCDEVIIIDDYSTDKTIDKVKSQKSKVKSLGNEIKIFQRRLNEDFAQQRNFGMEKCKNDWVLFVDADEEVTEKLKSEIRNPKSETNSKSENQNYKTEKIVAYYLKRRDFFWEKELKYGETRKIRQTGLIRLIKKNAGEWKGKVHEEYIVKSEKLKVKSLNNYINHYPHPTLKEFLKEINFYSTLRAKELFGQGKKTNILEIIFYPFGKFIYTYIFKLGFFDGAQGFVYAFLMSFHSFLVRAKLYQYSKIANNYRHSGER